MPAARTSRSANPSPLPTRRTGCEGKSGSGDQIALKDGKYLLVVQYIRHGPFRPSMCCALKSQHQASDNDPSQMRTVLLLIAQLYAVERTARDRGLRGEQLRARPIRMRYLNCKANPSADRAMFGYWVNIGFSAETELVAKMWHGCSVGIRAIWCSPIRLITLITAARGRRK